MFGLKARRRAALRETPLTDAQRAAVDGNVPAVASLDAAERARLDGIVQIFVGEVRFEGAGGLEITDEIRYTVASQAALLLLHRDVDDYPTLRTVVVYPRAYVVQHARRRPDGTVVEGPSARLGESWVRGEVILSWDDALRGAADPHDGHNVVLHELAHQLDSEVSGVDGAPDLGRSSRYVAWARVLGREYEALARDVARHRPTLLDPYGATAPAEFFAVATELFFERPAALRREHPELYEQLAAFYGHDRAGG